MMMASSTVRTAAGRSRCRTQVRNRDGAMTTMGLTGEDARVGTPLVGYFSLRAAVKAGALNVRSPLSGDSPRCAPFAAVGR